MSQQEALFTSRVVSGAEPLTETDGKLNSLAYLYLSILLFQEDFRAEVKTLVGVRFDALVIDRVRVMVPFLLKRLQCESILYGAESDIRFIVVGCPSVGIAIDEFVSITELGRIRREAHLRSAIVAKKLLHGNMRQPAIGVIASAVLAGITPEEIIGVSQKNADQYIDAYYHRNVLHLQGCWQSAKAEFEAINALFAS